MSLTLGAKPVEVDTEATDEPATEPSPRLRLPKEDGGLDRSLGAEGGSIIATAVLEPWGSGMLATPVIMQQDGLFRRLGES